MSTRADRQDDRMSRQDTRMDIADISSLDKNMAVLKTRFDNLEKKLDEVLETLKALPGIYATKEELKPLQRFVLGMQGAGVVVLMGILGLLITHVIPDFRL